MTGLTWSGSATTVSNGQSATGLVIRLFDTLLVEHGGTVTNSQVTGAGLGIQGGPSMKTRRVRHWCSA